MARPCFNPHFPLSPGARIRVIAPCGPVPQEPFDKGIEILKAWGIEPLISLGVTKCDRYLAGPDSERIHELVHALSDSESEAVWMARGGYGAHRIAEKFAQSLPENPLPLIGFSDGTALHSVLERAGHHGVHGPVITQLYRLDAASLENCRSFLFDSEFRFQWEGLQPFDKQKIHAEGELWGGNLALLTASIGTPFEVDLAGKIVFLEDVGEAPYRIDRMLQHLLQATNIKQAAGILLGDFSTKAEDLEWLHALWQEFAQMIPCPLWSGFPVGHGPTNHMIPIGANVSVNNTVCVAVRNE